MSEKYTGKNTIEDYQRSFAAFLLDPEFSIEHPIADLIKSPENSAAKNIDRSRDRLAVYRNNVIYSLTQALGAQFPITKRLVGDEFFLALARDYVRLCPPEEPSLTFYGKQFPDFIKKHEHCQTLPFLSDVARLELACQFCLHAADDETLHAQELSTVPEVDYGKLQLRLKQSTSFFTSPYAAVEIWQENLKLEPEQLNLAEIKGSKALIYRESFQVKVMLLRDDVYFLLDQLEQGKMLAAVYEECQAVKGMNQEAFSGMLGFLLGMAIFRDYKL